MYLYIMYLYRNARSLTENEENVECDVLSICVVHSDSRLTYCRTNVNVTCGQAAKRLCEK